MNRFAVRTTHKYFERIIEQSDEAFYWLGMILSDGHIFSEKNHISVTLFESDRDHLELYSQFVGQPVRLFKSSNPNSEKRVVVSCSSYDIVPRFIERYGVGDRKTEIPPTDPSLGLTDSDLMSVICGFIDGDGHISDRGYIAGRVKCHGAWRMVLDAWGEALERQSGIVHRPVRLSGKGYAVWDINGTKLEFLKAHAEDSNLPIMYRKWDKVRPKKIRRFNKHELELILAQEADIQTLGREHGLNESSVCWIRWKYKRDHGALLA